ncbi:50S ribosomal protein P1 [Candidatus Woesearchaeota archaeon]|nr:50S ribosomal protein P1 [Candidatus Woesearchaeota archaeon]
MEYIYSAMLLHKAGKEINEANIKKILESAGIKFEEARVKALVSALDGVNIDQAIKEAAVQQIAVAAQHPEKAEKKEEKKAEDEEKKAEEASAGLGSLFG